MITPERLAADAAPLPRDPTGRVLKQIRVEIHFPSGRGYRHYCDSWADAAAFLASPAFKQTATAVKAVTITVVNPHAGPPATSAPRLDDRGRPA